MLTIHWTFKYLPISLNVEDICKANSLVGTKTKLWIEFNISLSFGLVLINCKIGITNEPVFPVPFLALAIISFDFKATGITSSWTGEGLSYPFSKIPFKSSIFNL